MANEISSQITSTVLNLSRPAEQAGNRPAEQARERAINAVDDVSNRQDIAAKSANQPESAEVQGNDSEQFATKAQLEQAVSDINAYVQTINRELQFRVDEALPLGRTVVTVIDADTEETIREFPSKEALALAHRLKAEAGDATRSQIEGLIISARA
ncbi:flagellar protein FlaG [Sulfuriflexus mobilis]|uniref:flagellar protein FlaG n=1 Tax=Sulfuriflexus mobilis TaxID=1811807 RepID=UPI000F82E239|nr:flagellar protein FlaG [Sulfuriflexus mobilis]